MCITCDRLIKINKLNGTNYLYTQNTQDNCSKAFLIRAILSFLPSIAASSIPPPGVIALPESAALIGRSTQPFFTPSFSISARSEERRVGKEC